MKIHIIHKWEYFGVRMFGSWHGRHTTWVSSTHRRCKVCGKSQEYWHTMSNYGWDTLNNSLANTLNEMIGNNEIEPVELTRVISEKEYQHLKGKCK